jgi:rSAM/selenodomain-associated transferase 1
MIETLIVLAKQPLPGRVKTRLMTAFTAAQSATLAAAALADTLDVADQVQAARRVLAFDGDAADWLRPNWTLKTQGAGGLDQRLCAAFDKASEGAALLIGMDTPQLHAAQVDAFDPDRHDCCLGFTHDGGYWAIGFADPRMGRPAIAGIPMSTAHTGRRQLQRLRALGLRVQLLETLVDVDTPADARQVARMHPHNGFAASHAELAAVALGSIA